MSTDQVETTATPAPGVEKPAKLTKKGKPWKPYVMTDARKAAFEKCKAAKIASIQAKHEQKAAATPPVDNEIDIGA